MTEVMRTLRNVTRILKECERTAPGMTESKFDENQDSLI